MPVPTSTAFDVADWNPRAATSGGTGGLISHPTQGLVALANTAGSLLADQNLGGVLVGALHEGAKSNAHLPLPALASDYTLEIDLMPTVDIPESHVGDRAFVGVTGLGITAGVILTKRGLLLASSVTDTAPVMLPDTAGILHDASGAPRWVTLRLVVDSAAGRIAVYAAPSADVYVSDGRTGWQEAPEADLLVNLAVKQGVGARQLRAEAVSSTRSVLFGLGAVRIASTAVRPAVRPTAVLGVPARARTGTAVRLSGSNSHDTLGNTLTYEWDILNHPPEGFPRIQGESYASAASGTTSSDLRLVYRKPVLKGNKYTLEIVSPNKSFQPLVLTLSGYTVRVSVATTGGVVVTSTAADVISALNDPANVAYLPAIGELFTAEPANETGDATGVVTLGTFPLTGGAASTLPDPIILGRVPGVYVVALRVTSPVARSAWTPRAIVLANTVEGADATNDGDYVFKLLPDFWRLVEGKEALAAVWDAVAKTAASEAVRLWQSTFSSSIREISRKYQRRWLAFGMSDDVEGATITPADPAEFAVTAPTGALETRALNVPGTYVTAPITAEYVVLLSSAREPTVVRVARGSQLTDSFELALVTSAVVGSEVARGGTGSFVDNSYATTIATTRIFDAVLPVPALAGDHLFYTRFGTRVRGTVQARVSGSTSKLLLTAATAESHAVAGVSWELRRCDALRVVQSPYVTLPADSTLRTGDAVELEFASPYTGLITRLALPVLAASGRIVVPVWAPLLQALTAAATVAEDPREWTHADLAGLGLTVRRVVRTERSEVMTDLQSVPTLGTTASVQDLFEGADYTVRDGRVQILPRLHGIARAVAGGASLTLTSVHEGGTATLGSLALLRQQYPLVIRTGRNAGTYTCAVSTRGTVTLDRPLLFADTAEFCIPRYHAWGLPPERLWASLALFDNAATIEGTFGTMVGLPRHYLTDAGTDVDYLSVVRSLVYGFMSGPTPHSLGLVTDAFTGVPYAERAGQIITIVEPTERADGFVVVRDANGNTAYPYAYGLTLANHPTTGRVLKAVPLDAEAAGASFVEDLADATLPAYTRLFAANNVYDYISEPDKAFHALQGGGRTAAQAALAQFHTFLVDVPLNLVGHAEMLPLLRTALLELRPANTMFVLTGVVGLQEDITIYDTRTVEVALRITDAPYSTAVAGAATDNTFSMLGTSEREFRDGVTPTAADAYERYESGFHGVALDEYSGDGSANRAHREVDRIMYVGNNDVDVPRSLAWIPVTRVVSGAHANREFVVGEELEVRLGTTSGTILTADLAPTFLWDLSPPVIRHIGAGQHLRVPYLSEGPQTAHPNTYLVLGFDNEQPAESVTDPEAVRAVYSSEYRLDGAKIAAMYAYDNSTTAYVVGLTSGAAAELVIANVPSFLNGGQESFFLPRKNNALDRALDIVPESTIRVQSTAYIPVGGISVAAWQALSDGFAEATTGSAVQRFPYDTSESDTFQLVPSFGSGGYSLWGTTPPTNMQWDYEDEGVQGVDTVAAHTDYAPSAGARDLENVHVGFVRTNRAWRARWNGPVLFRLPDPVIYLSSYLAGSLRVEGYYFIAPDVTQSTVPGADADSFDGTKTGSWVFLRSEAGVEYAATAVTFETGTSGLRTVLGVNGATQTSTGHILIGTFVGVPAGAYYPVIRHYSTYVLSPTDNLRYHLQEAVGASTVTV